jgi:hypothetical protein
MFVYQRVPSPWRLALFAVAGRKVTAETRQHECFHSPFHECVGNHNCERMFKNARLKLWHANRNLDVYSIDICG